MVLLCPLCGTACHHGGQASLRALLKHIRLIHADEPNFSIQCTFQGCQTPPFTSYFTYRNHVYAFHNNYEGQDVLSTSNFSAGSDHDDSIHEDEVDDVAEHNIQGGGEEDNRLVQKSVKRAAATWILKVREKYAIPQSTIETIIKDIETLYEVRL